MCDSDASNWQLPNHVWSRLQVRATTAEIWSSCSLLGGYGFDPQVPKNRWVVDEKEGDVDPPKN